MLGQVLDYSAGFPGAQQIRDAGYLGAVRYIGFHSRPKCTTYGELQDFIAHDLGMALVFEDKAGNWRLGYGQGYADAQRGRKDADYIRFPWDRPIYMAIDQDVVRSGEFAAMIEYLQGAGDYLGGPGYVGVYGEADVIDRARDAGVASWFWQTSAWSRGRVTQAHLLQRVGAVQIGDVACDVSDVYAQDWGQYNGGAMPLSGETDKQFIADAVIYALTKDRDGDRANRNLLDKLNQIHDWSGEAISRLGLLSQAVDKIRQSGNLSPEDVQLLRAGLGSEVCRVLGQALSRVE